MSEKEVLRPEYEELADASVEGKSVGTGETDELEIHLIVSIGHCEIPLKDLMALKEGERVTLDKPVDAPVDLIVDGRVVGEGEIVVVDDHFGIRILSMAQKHEG